MPLLTQKGCCKLQTSSRVFQGLLNIACHTQGAKGTEYAIFYCSTTSIHACGGHCVQFLLYTAGQLCIGFNKIDLWRSVDFYQKIFIKSRKYKLKICKSLVLLNGSLDF